jgi:hypothetical protein
MFIYVKDNPFPLDKEIAMTYRPELPGALTWAHEQVLKVHEQSKAGRITQYDVNAQFLSILLDMKVALRKEFIGDLQDKLSDIEQLFTDVQGSIEELDYLTFVAK